MKSGLEGRNNQVLAIIRERGVTVSMKSGLEGRNNRDLRRIEGEANWSQ